MKTLRPVKATDRKSVRLLRTTLVILLAAAAAISVAALSLGRTNTSTRVFASQKRYKATRPIVVDQQTGQARMPNQQEIDSTVESLATLAKRPEDLQQSSGAQGGISIDLEGGYGGVMLARPNDSGGWETRCVFTFDEGAEFLGIVEDTTPE
jgi:hypothetical protein